MDRFYKINTIGMTHIYIRLWNYTTLAILLQKWFIKVYIGQADW